MAAPDVDMGTDHPPVNTAERTNTARTYTAEEVEVLLAERLAAERAKAAPAGAASSGGTADVPGAEDVEEGEAKPITPAKRKAEEIDVAAVATQAALSAAHAIMNDRTVARGRGRGRYGNGPDAHVWGAGRGRGAEAGGVRGGGRGGGRAGRGVDGRGRGGRGPQAGRGGGRVGAGRGGMVGPPDFDDPTPSNVYGPAGQRLTVGEVRVWKRDRRCFNCGGYNHLEVACTAPYKPVPNIPRGQHA
ncbi:hypothetical protein GPECTOR_144g723 [Gonium pectorale]|uniref:Uncharacterized protein n=1 Tax=Gonium pectorale TaxID=33097 RepID=A0A150FZH0_GONPE|nr:hypothetical protein GPECTOR_144g723 [Gonium pectorale]|eukprot:KXZ42460.1 hypothetical protein GPECTOR_144g723 [Gonium pectorale]